MCVGGFCVAVPVCVNCCPYKTWGAEVTRLKERHDLTPGSHARAVHVDRVWRRVGNHGAGHAMHAVTDKRGENRRHYGSGAGEHRRMHYPDPAVG